jgi:hypothetical protein
MADSLALYAQQMQVPRGIVDAMMAVRRTACGLTRSTGGYGIHPVDPVARVGDPGDRRASQLVGQRSGTLPDLQEERSHQRGGILRCASALRQLVEFALPDQFRSRIRSLAFATNSSTASTP